MKKDFDYAAKEKELQKILEWFEGDIKDIEEAVAKYKKAKELVNQLTSHLDTIKNEIKVISGNE